MIHSPPTIMSLLIAENEILLEMAEILTARCNTKLHHKDFFLVEAFYGDSSSRDCIMSDYGFMTQ